MSLDPASENKANDNESVVTLHAGKVSAIIEQLKEKFESKTSPEEKRENMRGAVTSRIIWMYVICVSCIIFAGVVKLFTASTPEAIKLLTEALRSLVDYLNVLVLPIITLVLGFYFGSEKR